MKKLLAILVLFTILTGGSAAFARDFDLKLNAFQGVPRYQQLQNQKRPIGDSVAAIRGKVAVINKNRMEINYLQQILRGEIKQIKTLVASLRKTPGSLNTETLTSIQKTLIKIELSRKSVGSTCGVIQAKSPELRAARQGGNPAIFMQHLDDIIEVQEKRIEALNQMTAGLNELENKLR